MSTYILSLNSNSNELVRILISSFLGNRKEKFNLNKKYTFIFSIFSESNNNEIDRVSMSSSFV